tara:strand:+ start:794 stop:1705 length:912 start_codon:yes stop_codon:yes gene_type:complete
MSRISRAPIAEGDTIAAADLNARFNDYTQNGSIVAGLNEFNVRDAAVDLPQVQSDWLAQAIYETTLGEFDLDHSSKNTVNAASAVPSAGHLVQNFSGTVSVLSFGAGGKVISTSDVLRLYWDLSVNPKYTGTPWTAAASFSDYVLDATGGSTVKVATSATVWVIYPEWDITSNALGNFAPVPGQGNFDTNYTGFRRGEALSTCQATCVIPAWIQIATASTNGAVPSVGLRANVIGWRGISGAWHYAGSDGAVTVYGIRWRIKGVLHPEQNSSVNYLGFDTGASNGVSLEYTSGKAQALVMRVK